MDEVEGIVSDQPPTPESPQVEPAEPYVGLRPYDREDRAVFFGRERDARFLVDKELAAR